LILLSNFVDFPDLPTNERRIAAVRAERKRSDIEFGNSLEKGAYHPRGNRSGPYSGNLDTI